MVNRIGEHRGGSYLQYAENLTPEERERGLDEAIRMFGGGPRTPYIPPERKVEPFPESFIERLLVTLESDPRYKAALRVSLGVRK